MSRQPAYGAATTTNIPALTSFVDDMPTEAPIRKFNQFAHLGQFFYAPTKSRRQMNA
jgi:hypothetical protein